MVYYDFRIYFLCSTWNINNKISKWNVPRGTSNFMIRNDDFLCGISLFELSTKNVTRGTFRIKNEMIRNL